MTEHERAAIDAHARTAGMATADYLRRMALQQPRDSSAPPTGAPARPGHHLTDASIRELSAIGLNLNQAVRLAHSGKLTVAAADIQSVIVLLQAAIRDIVP